MTTRKPKKLLDSATDVVIDLQQGRRQLMAGEISVKEFESITNSVGKEINMHKAQLEYNTAIAKDPSIKKMRYFEEAE